LPTTTATTTSNWFNMDATAFAIWTARNTNLVRSRYTLPGRLKIIRNVQYETQKQNGRSATSIRSRAALADAATLTRFRRNIVGTIGGRVVVLLLHASFSFAVVSMYRGWWWWQTHMADTTNTGRCS
jgi:hypothetical protein